MSQSVLSRSFVSVLVVLTLVSLIGTWAPAEDSTPDPLDGFQQYLDLLLNDFGVPGAAVAVVGAGPKAQLFVSGVTAVGADQPVTPATSFHIASMTKTFTATAAAVLVDEGVLGWDTPVREVIPEFELKDPIATRMATLRDLLAHRTGLGRNSVPGLNLSEDPSWWLPRVRLLEPEGEFRDRARYSGVMVAVAGMMLERAADTSWEHLLTSRLLEPLGMTRTTAGPPTDFLSRVARPHIAIDGETVALDLIVSSPDTFQSGLFSSADDLARWMRFLLDGGRDGERTLVSPTSLAETWTPQMAIHRPYNPRSRSVEAYGLGWHISTRNDVLELSHGGGWAGYLSHMVILPGKGLGVAVLTNLAMNPVPDLAINWILNRVLGIEAPDPREGAMGMVARMAENQRAAHRRALDERDPTAPPPLPLSAYTGTYGDFLFGEVEVGMRGNELTFHFHGIELEVNHLHGNVFLFSSPLFDDLRSEFQVTPEGAVSSVSVPIGGDGTMVVFRRPTAREAD